MLPIINILLIVGILLFILYNLYVDTRNWSNTGSFLEGMENSNDASASDTQDVPIDTSASAAPTGSVSAAGSASSAMEDQIKARAGNVAPMGSNVPQNCKQGCVAPTGPNGNCKVIQKDGAEKRECSYGCPVPTLERGDTVNCSYDKDCNSCGTKIFDPTDPTPRNDNAPLTFDQLMAQRQGQAGSQQGQAGSQQAQQGQPGQQMAQGQVQPGQQMVQGQAQPGQQMAQGQVQPGQQMVQGQAQQSQQGQQMVQGQSQQSQQGQQMVQGHMSQAQMNQLGPIEEAVMDNKTGSTVATVDNSNYSLFNEDIMKQVLSSKDLIPSDINSNNEETSFCSRIGRKFMIDTATIRNFALPNIDEQDYIELGRIVKSIKMREADPQEADQVKVLYSKLNAYVLELLTDSSLDMSSYDNRSVPKQLNNKTRTTGMFGENSNSLISNRQKVKPFNSIWSLYQ